MVSGGLYEKFNCANTAVPTTLGEGSKRRGEFEKQSLVNTSRPDQMAPPAPAPRIQARYARQLHRLGKYAPQIDTKECSTQEEDMGIK